MKLKDIDLKTLHPDKKYDFLLPIGATEQHGPFLPFGTDTYILDRIISKVESELQDLVILPTLEYSLSKEHRGFNGTIWLEPTTLNAVLRDYIASIEPYAQSLALVSWHGGNETFLNSLVSNNTFSFRVYKINLEDNEITHKTEKIIGGPVDEHAGNTEISMMLAIDATLVTLPDNYPKSRIEEAFSTGFLYDTSKDGIADSHPSWVISKEIGEELIKLHQEKCIKEIKNILG